MINPAKPLLQALQIQLAGAFGLEASPQLLDAGIALVLRLPKAMFGLADQLGHGHDDGEGGISRAGGGRNGRRRGRGTRGRLEEAEMRAVAVVVGEGAEAGYGKIMAAGESRRGASREWQG